MTDPAVPAINFEIAECADRIERVEIYAGNLPELRRGFEQVAPLLPAVESRLMRAMFPVRDPGVRYASDQDEPLMLHDGVYGSWAFEPDLSHSYNYSMWWWVDDPCAKAP